MKKKLNCLFVALIMAMTMMPSMAFAEDGNASGGDGKTSTPPNPLG